MGTTDGTVVGVSKILDHGSPAARWNLVLLGDGYTTAQLPAYHADAQALVTKLLGTAPFSVGGYFTGPLSSAINVYRVDVSSTDSGADDPAACGGPGTVAKTYFDAAFCNSGVRRALVVNQATALAVAQAQVPQFHAVMVLVNSTVYGGTGGAVATYSMAVGADEIGLHELGHSAFGLADEYEYYAGCGAESGHDNHPPGEPSEPNVTLDANRATNKWRQLIDPATPMPTTVNPNCAACDAQASPVPVGTVGAFEGAHYYHCKSYRPEFNCRMRALNQPFCAVCQARIREVLAPFRPPPRWERIFELPELRFRFPREWVADPSPVDLVRLAQLLERGNASEPIQADELSEVMERMEHLDALATRDLLQRVDARMTRLGTAQRLLQKRLDRLSSGSI